MSGRSERRPSGESGAGMERQASSGDRKCGANTEEGRDRPRPARGPDGRFLRGNPGKPRGARHRASRAAAALLEGEAEALARKAVELALAGDVVALRLCLERLVPPVREASISLALPALETPADAVAALAALVTAVARGEVPPGAAARLAGLIGSWREGYAVEEMERRLARLEAALASGEGRA